MKPRKTLHVMNVSGNGAVFGDLASKSGGTVEANENGGETCKLG
jgi:hypothetical protein